MAKRLNKTLLAYLIPTTTAFNNEPVLYEEDQAGDDGLSDQNHIPTAEEEGIAAGYFIIIVILVYATSIVFLIASYINRKNNKRQEDKRINTYLKEYQVVLECSRRDRIRNLKKRFSAMLLLHHQQSETDDISKTLLENILPLTTLLGYPLNKQEGDDLPDRPNGDLSDKANGKLSERLNNDLSDGTNCDISEGPNRDLSDRLNADLSERPRSLRQNPSDCKDLLINCSSEKLIISLEDLLLPQILLTENTSFNNSYSDPRMFKSLSRPSHISPISTLSSPGHSPCPSFINTSTEPSKIFTSNKLRPNESLTRSSSLETNSAPLETLIDKKTPDNRRLNSTSRLNTCVSGVTNDVTSDVNVQVPCITFQIEEYRKSPELSGPKAEYNNKDANKNEIKSGTLKADYLVAKCEEIDINKVQDLTSNIRVENKETGKLNACILSKNNMVDTPWLRLSAESLNIYNPSKKHIYEFEKGMSSNRHGASGPWLKRTNLEPNSEQRIRRSRSLKVSETTKESQFSFLPLRNSNSVMVKRKEIIADSQNKEINKTSLFNANQRTKNNHNRHVQQISSV